jgi:two-component sensor histidine kinase
VHIAIGDNGVGLPIDFDPSKTDSLGLQLVYTLIEQLDATIETQAGKGTKYLITFDKSKV